MGRKNLDVQTSAQITKVCLRRCVIFANVKGGVCCVPNTLVGTIEIVEQANDAMYLFHPGVSLLNRGCTPMYTLEGAENRNL